MPKKRKPDIVPRRQAHIYLAEHMARRGLNPDQLADRLETARSVIYKLMSGEQRYNQDWLEQIAWALGVDVPELFHPPLEPDAKELLGRLSPGRRKTAIGVLENLVDEEKTGTDG